MEKKLGRYAKCNFKIVITASLANNIVYNSVFDIEL